MGEEGEKVCLLCTEEMDLTDQQLKPCKCGYQICVWCWHHIMDMAEKDATEGRCPACRTAYDKEKIVGMTVKCERVNSENNSERRLKPHKGKPKASEGRKHLSSIRVIQRNLVYIMGIPSSLADEEVLQHKEYFGQYGKVLKVSMSRNAGGAIQHFPNNTCSVYITYSQEDEAVRCIQSVHGFVLEDRPLKACFGTTKYCHAWLRNTPCNNPECLYLHEVGMEEDSFSKDEIVSAYTRSRVQQITGAINNLPGRSGNVLPPPPDDLCNSSAPSEKPIARSVPNNSPSHIKGSRPSGDSGRSIALPAAASWGARVSNGHPLTIASDSSSAPTKHNTDGCNGSFGPQREVPSTTKASMLLTDVVKKSMGTEENHVVCPNGKSVFSGSSKQPIGRDCNTTTSDTPQEVVRDTFPTTAICVVSGSKDAGVTMLLNFKNSKQLDRQPSNIVPDKGGNAAKDETAQSLCSGLSSISVDSNTVAEMSNSSGSVSIPLSSSSLGNDGLEKLSSEHCSKPFVREPVTSLAAVETARASDCECVSRELSNWGSESLVRCGEAQEDLEDLDGQSLKASDVGHSLHLPNSSNLLKALNHSNEHSWSASNHASVDHRALGMKDVETLLPSRSTELLFSNGYFENKINSSAELERTSDNSRLQPNVEASKYLGSFNDEPAEVLGNSNIDMHESSIISNILSMDFDPWNVSLVSPHNLAKLFTDTDSGSLNTSSSWKVPNSNQSRFSFARQDDLVNQGPYLEPSSSNTVSQDSMMNEDLYFEKRQPGFSSFVSEESDTFPRSYSINSLGNLSASRTPFSAPPGFSVPSRAAPPGFSSQDRVDQAFNITSVNHFLENSLRNQYRTPPAGRVGNLRDIEFNDPAIMAVGKRMASNGINNTGLDLMSAFSTQNDLISSRIDNSGLDMKSAFSPQNDPRLQLLMQQSLSTHPNLRFTDHIGDRFSHLTDAYGTPARNSEQSPFAHSKSKNAYISNGLWDGGNDFGSGNDHIISELLRNETLGLNKYCPGRDDLKYQIPSSGDLYKREFGM